MSWMQRLHRVFDIDLQSCPRCGGTVGVIAAITAPAYSCARGFSAPLHVTEPALISRILEHRDGRDDFSGKAPAGLAHVAKPGDKYILRVYIQQGHIMQTARIFTNGNSQAVRPPKEFCFDTDICIYMLNQRPGFEDILKHLNGRSQGEVIISDITLAKLRFGIAASKRRDFNSARLELFMALLAIFLD